MLTAVRHTVTSQPGTLSQHPRHVIIAGMKRGRIAARGHDRCGRRATAVAKSAACGRPALGAGDGGIPAPGHARRAVPAATLQACDSAAMRQGTPSLASRHPRGSLRRRAGPTPAAAQPRARPPPGPEPHPVRPRRGARVWRQGRRGEVEATLRGALDGGGRVSVKGLGSVRGGAGTRIARADLTRNRPNAARPSCAYPCGVGARRGPGRMCRRAEASGRFALSRHAARSRHIARSPECRWPSRCSLGGHAARLLCCVSGAQSRRMAAGPAQATAALGRLRALQRRYARSDGSSCRKAVRGGGGMKGPGVTELVPGGSAADIPVYQAVSAT